MTDRPTPEPRSPRPTASEFAAWNEFSTLVWELVGPPKTARVMTEDEVIALATEVGLTVERLAEIQEWVAHMGARAEAAIARRDALHIVGEPGDEPVNRDNPAAAPAWVASEQPETKEIFILSNYRVFPTKDKDGIVLVLYGTGRDGQLIEITSVVMHPKAASQLADALEEVRFALLLR